MDGTVIVLVLILFALWAIKGALEKIEKSISYDLQRIANEIANNKSNFPSFPSLSVIEWQLKNVVKLMGGEAKMKEENTKWRKDLHTRYIKALILSGKTTKQAKAEASEKFEEAEFQEAHVRKDDLSSSLYGVEGWVIAVEFEERNKNKYGNLLPKARLYIKGKTIIKPNEMNLVEALETDDKGAGWLIEKLIEEKRLKRVGEYKSDDYGGGGYELDHYEVLEPKK